MKGKKGMRTEKSAGVVIFYEGETTNKPTNEINTKINHGKKERVVESNQKAVMCAERKQGCTNRKYLILNYTAGHWDFAKGHVEKGESLLNCAKREAYEETGLSELFFVPKFKKKVTYFFRKNDMLVKKSVVFFLAKTCKVKVRLSFEHKKFEWLEYEEAMKKLTYQTAKDVLSAAENALIKMQQLKTTKNENAKRAY
ncbi:MAG: NUDIX domain-containing protein [Candidatus Woesearchaeota archaeon]